MVGVMIQVHPFSGFGVNDLPSLLMMSPAAGPIASIIPGRSCISTVTVELTGAAGSKMSPQLELALFRIQGTVPSPLSDVNSTLSWLIAAVTRATVENSGAF